MRKSQKKEVEEKKEILNVNDMFVKLQTSELQKFWDKYHKIHFYKIKMSNGWEYLCSKREMFLHKEYKVLTFQDNYGFAIYDQGDSGRAYQKANFDWETYENYENNRKYAIKKEAESLEQYKSENTKVEMTDYAEIPEKAL